MAGGTLLLGCDGLITALDSADGSAVWETEVAGQVRGLAISDGRLIATLGTGAVICFEAGAQGEPSVVAEPGLREPHPRQADLLATQLARQAGKLKGYALAIGSREAGLAEALAARTELHVVAVLPNADAVAAERERLLATGLYGKRVWVTSVNDAAHLPFAPYFADLVVVAGAVGGVSPAECYRALRPCGGALCFAGMDAAERAEFIAAADIPAGEVSEDRSIIVRGELPGAGTWRYPWADGGRTGVSADKRVRLPLELLWFGGPGPDRMMDRHLMTSPPVSAHGRVFVTGQDDVIAFDAYNGRELWSRSLPGVGRKYAQYYSSGLVADEAAVYAVQGTQCHRFDQATGETLAVYDIPASVISDTPPPVVQQYVSVQWPETWRAIGPFPKGAEAIAPEALGTIPESVTVDGQERVAVEVTATDGIIDFTNLYGGWGLEPLAEGEEPATSPRRGGRTDLQQAGQVAYVFATINCPADGKLLVGAGADWWMQWFLDGRPVFDTLKGGNEPSRHDYRSREACSETDYIFDVDVTAGEHVLTAIVKSGSRGWSLASASLADRAAEVMPIVTGDENLPELGSMVWGYVSAAGDLVLGSYNVPIVAGQPGEDHLVWRSESKAVFALNREDGSLRWVYRPEADRTVSNIEIAFGDGRLFLIDATSKADSIRARRRGEDLDIKVSLVAMDLADGTELWRQDDVPVLGDRSLATRIKSNPSHLFMGLPNWEHLVYSDGVVVLGANAAYDAATGEKMWQAATRPKKLPIVHGEWLITQPFAFNLRTGEQRMSEDILTGAEVPWRFGRAYGCGPINGCENLLFFRSGADGFFDMNARGTTNFGGIRAGCARSLIAAHGLLIHPEGYSGCACSYNYQTSMALVPASEGSETWYVFERGVSVGEIKRIAINLGAPGDQRDDRDTAWLGFPRPLLPTACPAPVTVLMDRASSYHKQRATAAITGTDAPWVYSSGISGSGRIAVALTLQPNVVMPTRDAAPTLDGKLDDPCWEQAGVATFENSPFTILGASVDLRVFRDAQNLYFGYRRAPLANPRADADEATLRASDELDIYLTQRPRLGKRGIRFVIGRGGETSAAFGNVDRYRKIDPNWRGEWECVTTSTPGEWAAEVVIPLATLTASGLDVDGLMLNCMSRNLTASGLEAIFLTDPTYGSNFRRCIRFRSVADAPADPPAERSFTVRLHFAELDGAAAGERVFDVALQGATVVEGLDIAGKVAGNAALVKEFTGVLGSESIAIELTPRAGAVLPPIISGIEIVEGVDEP
jgi:outer membrane protein assembly factor BamB